MKKYGLVILLLIFSRSVFAGDQCYFAINKATVLYLKLIGPQSITLPSNTNEAQLIAEYQTQGVVTSYYQETQNANANAMDMTVVQASSAFPPPTTKAPNGALLYPVYPGAQQTGFALAFKVSGPPGTRYITESGTYGGKEGTLFPGLTKEQCNNATWTITAELWHVGNYYKNESKLTTITTMPSVSYFTLYFNTHGYGDSSAHIYFDSSAAITVAPTTCNLSINSPTIDFGKLYVSKPKSWPTKEVILTSNGCSQVGAAQLRILSNGHMAKGFIALGNQLTGDNAAQNILVSFTDKSGADIKMDIGDSAEGLSCDDESLIFDSDGFINSCTHTVTANIYPMTTREPTTGDFSTSATFSVTYY
ncbi:TPA: fimbrial protein [Citrobacter gillenii]|nr:fimbrial protein [Citrobacter gillenii]